MKIPIFDRNMRAHLKGRSSCSAKALTVLERTLWELGMNRMAYKVFMRDWRA